MFLFLLVVPALASIAIIAHYQLGTRIDADNIFFCSYELMIRRVEGDPPLLGLVGRQIAC